MIVLGGVKLLGGDFHGLGSGEVLVVGNIVDADFSL
jgi:hypothetical protein